VISQERLKLEVKLLLNANRKSHTPRQLAQQRMTLSHCERSFDASRAISAVAVLFSRAIWLRCCVCLLS